MLKIALTGNPNSGKTTLFNTLTGAKQHVGNWPGKTVEKKEGTIIANGKKATIIDLPGIYSLTSFSAEEKITREYLSKEKPDIVIDVIDATNLERNLYLALELLELKTNLVLAINMDHLARKKGIIIDPEKISKLLGVPVQIVDARDKKESTELIKEAKPKKVSDLNYGEEIEEHILSLTTKIKDDNYPKRWTAIKLLEEDPEIKKEFLKGDLDIEYNNIKKHLLKIYGKDYDTMISDYRHGIAQGIVRDSVDRRKMNRFSRTDAIDKLVLNKFIGIPIFLLAMYLLFQLTFTVADPFIGFIESLLEILAVGAQSLLKSSPDILNSLIIDGLIGGVGSVIVFHHLKDEYR